MHACVRDSIRCMKAGNLTMRPARKVAAAKPQHVALAFFIPAVANLLYSLEAALSGMRARSAVKLALAHFQR